jgi:bifunctional non-homologous end joining protein LigD
MSPTRRTSKTDGRGSDRKLAEYQRKRDFGATPEPAGAPEEEVGESSGRFVIQQHDATRLHWDLRLERDGVLASWALPKGLPRTPAKNHLAVHTEDHPLEYLDFEGDIPDGNYGAGHMFVWDRGTYDALEWEENKLVVELRGERARGRHALFSWKGRDWMIHRMDAPEPGWVDPPEDLRPMLGRPGRLPAGDEWAHEVRWPGRRVLARCEPGDVHLIDGDGQDISLGFPDVRRLGRATGSLSVVLDGVLVLLGPDGVPRADEEVLTARAAAAEGRARRLADQHPAALMVFDALWMNGHALDGSYRERREVLDGFELSGPAWQTPAYHAGDGKAFLAAVAAQGLPGIVSKRLDSEYRPGQASRDWRLVDAA